jgi:hypothetical protein
VDSLGMGRPQQERPQPADVRSRSRKGLLARRASDAADFEAVHEQADGVLLVVDVEVDLRWRGARVAEPARKPFDGLAEDGVSAWSAAWGAWLDNRRLFRPGQREERVLAFDADDAHLPYATVRLGWAELDVGGGHFAALFLRVSQMSPKAPRSRPAVASA